MSRGLIQPLSLCAATFGVGLFWAVFPDSPMRPLLAFWFMLTCPGMALVGLLRIERIAARWTLAVAFSLALSTTVAEGMVLTRAWSPTGGFLVLAGVTVAGAALQFRQVYRREARSPQPLPGSPPLP